MEWGEQLDAGGEWFLGPEKMRVLVVDDQVAVREMTVMTLWRLGFCVVDEAASGEQARRMVEPSRAQVVVTGLALPELSGPDLLGSLRRDHPEVRTVVFTGSRNTQLIEAGLNARPYGFVHKTDSLVVFREAMAAVARGGTFFGPFATAWLNQNELRRNGLTSIPPRQRQVLQLLAEGLSIKQAAAKMAVSPRTAEGYRTQLMERLGLRDIASLTRFAVRCGVVD